MTDMVVCPHCGGPVYAEPKGTGRTELFPWCDECGWLEEEL